MQVLVESCCSLKMTSDIWRQKYYKLKRNIYGVLTIEITDVVDEIKTPNSCNITHDPDIPVKVLKESADVF